MCKIEILLGSSDANRMLLIAGDLLVAQETDMALFTITEHHLVNTMYGVSMEIKFKRKIMSEMMTTYLPSVLLMLITFATTFFKPFFFEAALSVNLTTMLVKRKEPNNVTVKLYISTISPKLMTIRRSGPF